MLQQIKESYSTVALTAETEHCKAMKTAAKEVIIIFIVLIVPQKEDVPLHLILQTIPHILLIFQVSTASQLKVVTETLVTEATDALVQR